MSSASSSKLHRVAVLSVVKHAYLPRAVAAHPQFDPVVVADDASEPDWVHERNELFAREIGVPYVRDVERAIREFDVSVAAVSPQAERHYDLSVRAANLGLHVVQDKPMSTTLSECDRLVDANEKAGVKFLMWNRNFLPAIVQTREAIASGAIGDLQTIHCDFYFSKDSGPPKGTREPGDPPINWLERQIEAHADGSDGGVGREPMGELEIEGIYPLAYLRLLIGAEVKRVFARTTAHFHQANFDNDVEDLATVSLEMEGGALATLCIGRIGAASHPDIGEIKLHLLGTEGALVMTEARPEVSVFYRDQPAKEFRNRRVANQNDYLLMQNLCEAIENDDDTILNVRSSRAIFATVQAAIESGRSGRPVEL